jgi:hypothetical protein
MEASQLIDNIKSEIECKICFEKLIKLSNEEFCKFVEDNKFFNKIKYF